jgi:hypothetical protein
MSESTDKPCDMVPGTGDNPNDSNGPMRDCPADQSVVVNTGVSIEPHGANTYKLFAINGNRDKAIVMIVLWESWQEHRVTDSQCKPEMEIPPTGKIYLGEGVIDNSNFPVGDWWIMYHSRFKDPAGAGS